MPRAHTHTRTRARADPLPSDRVLNTARHPPSCWAMLTSMPRGRSWRVGTSRTACWLRARAASIRATAARVAASLAARDTRTVGVRVGVSGHADGPGAPSSEFATVPCMHRPMFSSGSDSTWRAWLRVIAMEKALSAATEAPLRSQATDTSDLFNCRADREEPSDMWSVDRKKRKDREGRTERRGGGHTERGRGRAHGQGEGEGRRKGGGHTDRRAGGRLD